MGALYIWRERLTICLNRSKSFILKGTKPNGGYKPMTTGFITAIVIVVIAIIGGTILVTNKAYGRKSDEIDPIDPIDNTDKQK